ncbi:uncharacterized protein LOC144567105 [Carex rostrata]
MSWGGLLKRRKFQYVTLIKDMYDDVVTSVKGHTRGDPLLFANDAVLIDESRIRVDRQLELWKHTLESNGFRLSRTKIEYMRCEFSCVRLDDGDVTLAGQVVPGKDTFRYLGSMLQSDDEIDEDVSHRI